MSIVKPSIEDSEEYLDFRQKSIEFKKTMEAKGLKSIETSIEKPLKRSIDAIEKSIEKEVKHTTIQLTKDFKDLLKKLKGSRSFEEYLKERLEL